MVTVETSAKIFISFAWVINQTVGNGLLFGLYDFEKNGGDQLKRNLIDMVSTYVDHFSEIAFHM